MSTPFFQPLSGAATSRIASSFFSGNINNIDLDHRRLEFELPSLNTMRTECTFAAGPEADCLGECNGSTIVDGCGYCGGPENSNYACVCEDDGL